VSLSFFHHRLQVGLSKRVFQKMTNVTADAIALGLAGGRVAAVSREHQDAEVREAREKPASSALSQYGFDVELVRLFARGRRSSAPATAGLGAVAAAVATTWVPLDKVMIWIALDAAALFVTYQFAGGFLAGDASKLDPARWR
jgi:hypothetical protein